MYVDLFIDRYDTYESMINAEEINSICFCKIHVYTDNQCYLSIRIMTMSKINDIYLHILK